ncbi:MAG: hypothetical protein M1830_006381 [Pleopsidium flavum]|nr:MAG: hypothetical protein M1830_006381 [Pleopsidium flavum]
MGGTGAEEGMGEEDYRGERRYATYEGLLEQPVRRELGPTQASFLREPSSSQQKVHAEAVGSSLYTMPSVDMECDKENLAGAVGHSYDGYSGAEHL